MSGRAPNPNERGTQTAHASEVNPGLTQLAGDDKAPQRARHTFKVQGLDCAEEVAVLRRAVGPLVGDDKLAFDILNGRMTVLDGAPAVSPDKITEAVRRTGMTAVEWRAETKQIDGSSDQYRQHRVWFTTLSGLFVLVGFALHVWLAGGFAEAFRLLAGHGGQPTPLPETIAYALAVGFGIRFVIIKAWYAARSLRPDMNLLMTVAVAGAIIIGEWF